MQSRRNRGFIDGHDHLRRYPLGTPPRAPRPAHVAWLRPAAASQLVTALDFSRPLPVEYRRTVAQQLSDINTDASLAKLDQLLDSQNDPKLRVYVTRRSSRYVPIEELGQRWQKNHDIVTLNILCDDWLKQVYEGYPMDEVIAIMGQPQRGDHQSAYYVSKEGPVFYLELNAARQIGGRDGPR